MAVVVDDDHLNQNLNNHQNRNPITSLNNSNNNKNSNHQHQSATTNASAAITTESPPPPPPVIVTTTARRLAFTLEALQSCTESWQNHGALTLIRVHYGPKNKRCPNHLTLASNATSVVLDEPFVEPYRTLMRRVIKTCRRSRSRCRSSSSSHDGGGIGIPCYTVDGSTTVPPCMKLLRRPVTTTTTTKTTGHIKGHDEDDDDGDLHFTIGTPTIKAWKWQEQTKELRKQQIYSVCYEKAFDPPELIHKLRVGLEDLDSSTTFDDYNNNDDNGGNDNEFTNNSNSSDGGDQNNNNSNSNIKNNRNDSTSLPHSHPKPQKNDLSRWPVLRNCLRTMWWKPQDNQGDGSNQQQQQSLHDQQHSTKLDDETGNDCTSRTITTTASTTHNCNVLYEAPGRRPWTVDELLAIEDCKEWVMTKWDGVDVSVRPCQQTHGSQQAALRRWKSFVQSDKIKNYAKLRNKISEPHAVSRISCYLNLGILSIFDVVQDVWRVRSSQKGFVAGTDKFLDEIIKFREGSYVHCFSTPFYHTESVLPVWSRRHLETMYRQGGRRPNDGFSFEQLSSASTGDEVWDAMQRYLIETGELHNNARMTWGKTVVHWQAKRFSAGEVLHQLICLNDRYALDGLSPPSYFGMLWCFGFQDKPSKASPAGQPQISTKWASQYRQGSSGFKEAMAKLYSQSNKIANSQSKNGGNRSILDYASVRNSQNVEAEPPSKKIRPTSDSSSSSSNSNNSKDQAKKGTNSIMSYFSPANK